MKRRAFLVGAGAAAVPAALVGARSVRSDDADDEPPIQRASTTVERAGDRRPDFEVESVCYRETDGGTKWTFRARNDENRPIEATWRVVDDDLTGRVAVPADGEATFRVPVERRTGPTVAVAEDGDVVGVADAGKAPPCGSKE